MTFQEWTLTQLRQVLPLEDSDLEQIIGYVNGLDDVEATAHLHNLLGDSTASNEFIASYIERRSGLPEKRLSAAIVQQPSPANPPNGHPSKASKASKANTGSDKQDAAPPPSYASTTRTAHHHHTNAVIEAGKIRAKDEQEMQQHLQNLQYRYRIYNSEIEPEHDSDYYCSCPIHQYIRRKQARAPVLEQWSKAVQYPGEKYYSDVPGVAMLTWNPYNTVPSVFGYGMGGSVCGLTRALPDCHAANLRQTIALNNRLNGEAQAKIDAYEPKISVWEAEDLADCMSKTTLNDAKPPNKAKASAEGPGTRRKSVIAKDETPSRFSRFRKALGGKSSEEKALEKARDVRDAILAEERGRWPDPQWRHIVATYQDKVGMTAKIATLRSRCPVQYLHLLRAGYFEPIPVAWASQASNPLKFSVEAAAGIRGITPAWRGYEDLAEERLYWVLNHREGSVGIRMKPDFISEMSMAQARMATAVEPPPLYFAADDTCHVQHTSAGYSKQVMPTPFRAYDRPEQASDDSMILLDVSGSMDFSPIRPVYEQYLITGYQNSTQPKNRDVARAIVRRFTDALANHDHQSQGYDLVTFANRAEYVGTVNHSDFDEMWGRIRLGGGTRVMTGWQMVKDLHFQKHSASAVHHPVYGWQAGPETPMLRLLLLLDGEATDMDEFELDLLGLSWAHVTIFLIGVDGCPHHHRHANELQRISDVNHHVSFVDAQGNCPERFVTHELLKRHLGYDVSMREFEQMEHPPVYTEIA